MERYIGLDIGGTKCAAILASVENGINVIAKKRFATPSDFDSAFAHLCESVDELLRENELTAQQIAAIGVSCGGPLDSAMGVVLCPPNLPDWHDVPIVELLMQRFGRPVFLQNDANACALVEWRLGAGRGTRNMIFLTMGTGLGGGVIANGRLLTGRNDMAGEVGHIRLAESGPVGFGKAGSFEGFASGGGIARQAVAYTQALQSEGREPRWAREQTEQAPDAKLLAEYARRGDEDALAFFRTVGKMLGRGLAILTDAFNPEKIVIGSVFARCEELLRPTMEEELQKEAIPEAVRGLSVVAAQTGERLGDYAGVMAALYALNIDPMNAALPPKARMHYERLFERYPLLLGCREQVMDAYVALERRYRAGGKLLLCGNGGSCADCNHIVGELMKGFYLKRPLPDERRRAVQAAIDELCPHASELLEQGLPAISLTEHTALGTAFANDVDPVLCYAQQVMALGGANDALIGISTSGNAKNVALAVRTAKALGLCTIGLTGGDGGRLAKDCDIAVIVPGTSPADVQELHLPVYHTLCAMLEATFFEE